MSFEALVAEAAKLGVSGLGLEMGSRAQGRAYKITGPRAGQQHYLGSVPEQAAFCIEGMRLAFRILNGAVGSAATGIH